MRIALEQTYSEEAESHIAGHNLIYFDNRNDSREKVLEAVSQADIMVMRWPFTFPIDRAFLEKCPNLKLIHKSGTGLEHTDVLDLDALADLGILFSNNAGINAGTVAEQAMLLTLLALRPGTYNQIGDMRGGKWDPALHDGVPAPMTLEGKTVGIVGMGQIGTAAAIRYRAMGVGRILAYQRTQRFEQVMYGGVEWATLPELLSESDVILLCLPINVSTQNLIGRNEIALIKSSAVIVNVGRGGVLDEQALYDALAGGRIRFAGLDVLAKEPSDSPLMGLPNVFATPHMAGTAIESQKQQIARSIAAVGHFLDLKRPLGLANASVLATPQLRADWLSSNEGAT